MTLDGQKFRFPPIGFSLQAEEFVVFGLDRFVPLQGRESQLDLADKGRMRNGLLKFAIVAFQLVEIPLAGVFSQHGAETGVDELQPVPVGIEFVFFSAAAVNGLPLAEAMQGTFDQFVI